MARKGALYVALALCLFVAICGVIVTYKTNALAQDVLEEFPPTGPILQIDGTQVHAHVEGAGPDLVLLHGASGNAREFTFSLVGKLKDSFRVIALDRPGHGYTGRIESRAGLGESPIEQANLLSQAARELGADNPIVLGQSFGGAVALAWALEHPDNIAAFVNVSGVSNPWPGKLDPWYRLTNTFLGRKLVIPLVSAFVPRSYIENSVKGIFEPDPVPEGYLEHIGPALSLRTITLHANTQQINELRPHIVKMAERYNGLTIPVEIVHGNADTTVPLPIHSIPLSQQIPDAKLVVLDGVGHMPHHAREDEVIAAINRAAKRAGLR